MNWIATTGPRRFVINSASIFGGEAVVRLATAFMTVVIARSFGTAALGNYGYALALTSVLLLVPDFGLHLFAVRELSASPHRFGATLRGVFLLKLLLAAAVVVFTIGFGEWRIPSLDRRVLFYILAVRVLLQTFSHGVMAVFRAYERMHYAAIAQFVNSAIAFVWTAACLMLNSSLPIMIAGMAASQLAETCLGLIFLQRNFADLRTPLRETVNLWPIAAASFPVGITTILLALDLRIDIFVLNAHATSRELGQFNAAAWFIMATFLGASLFMSIVFPKLSRLFARDKSEAGDYVLSLLKNGLLAAAAASLLVWFAAPSLMAHLFGRDFAPAAHVLRILAPALPLYLLNTIFFYIFSAEGRRFVCLFTLVLGLAAGVSLSTYLTSRYGLTGCATANVARELIMSGTYLAFLIRGRWARTAGFALLKVFAGATALMSLMVVLGGFLRIEFMAVAAWMFFVLAGTLVVLGFPRAGEWQLLMDDRL